MNCVYVLQVDINQTLSLSTTDIIFLITLMDNEIKSKLYYCKYKAYKILFIAIRHLYTYLILVSDHFWFIILF